MVDPAVLLEEALMNSLLPGSGGIGAAEKGGRSLTGVVVVEWELRMVDGRVS